MWRRFSVLMLGLAGTACAAASSSTRPMASAGREVITAAEIVASRVTDVYQAVTQLRPEFLRKRNTTPMVSYSRPQVVVYLDDMEFGYPESLRHIPLDRVRQIRYLSRSEADLRWGRYHPAGAIHVVTVK
jgi:hypothetical protein